MNSIQALNIGHLARQILNRPLSGNVWGNTSKGVFLKFQHDGMVFLSYERFKGPFTINIPISLSNRIRDVVPGTQVQYGSDGMIHFEDIALGIPLDGITPWQPESFHGLWSAKELSSSLDSLTGWLKAYTQPGSFGLLSASIEVNNKSERKNISELSGKLHDVYKAMKISDHSLFIKSVSGLIGLGTGLTPSGDDFLTGMCLTSHRYNKIHKPLGLFSNWFIDLYPMISAKTTVLSTALFSAALQGSADERLIQVFDLILSGRMIKEEIIPIVSSWGSSSGFDSLAGFYILMKAINS